MGAERAPRKSVVAGERGQSLLEFLFLMPLMFGLTALMFKISLAINMSIVNQQYARAQALYLAFNSPEYPERVRPGSKTGFDLGQEHRMTLGVSENVAPPAGERYDPQPMVATIARAAKGLGRGPAKAEPDKRTDIRIRDTVALCAPSRVIKTGGSFKPIASSLSDPVSSASVFAYCRSKLDE
jgi:hypothetical protein